MEQMPFAPTDPGALRTTARRSGAGERVAAGEGERVAPGAGEWVAPGEGEWVAITSDDLPEGDILRWATTPGCGAVVVFSGTVRDHSVHTSVHSGTEGHSGGVERSGVTHLEYEAYAEPAERQMREIASEVRRRWPMAGRIALIHRIGRLDLGESAVLVAVGTPHRPAAFAAASWAIDELKASVPIWKKEFWAEGSAWVEGCQRSYAEDADQGALAGLDGRGAGEAEV